MKEGYWALLRVWWMPKSSEGVFPHVCKANCHSSTLEISRGATLDDLYQVSASRMLKPTSKADSKPIHRRKILCRSKGENALKAAAPL